MIRWTVRACVRCRLKVRGRRGGGVRVDGGTAAEEVQEGAWLTRRREGLRVVHRERSEPAEPAEPAASEPVQ